MKKKGILGITIMFIVLLADWIYLQPLNSFASKGDVIDENGLTNEERLNFYTCITGSERTATKMLQCVCLLTGQKNLLEKHEMTEIAYTASVPAYLYADAILAADTKNMFKSYGIEDVEHLREVLAEFYDAYCIACAQVGSKRYTTEELETAYKAAKDQFDYFLYEIVTIPYENNLEDIKVQIRKGEPFSDSIIENKQVRLEEIEEKYAEWLIAEERVLGDQELFIDEEENLVSLITFQNRERNEEIPVSVYVILAKATRDKNSFDMNKAKEKAEDVLEAWEGYLQEVTLKENIPLAELYRDFLQKIEKEQLINEDTYIGENGYLLFPSEQSAEMKQWLCGADRTKGDAFVTEVEGACYVILYDTRLDCPAWEMEVSEALAIEEVFEDSPKEEFVSKPEGWMNFDTFCNEDGSLAELCVDGEWREMIPEWLYITFGKRPDAIRTVTDQDTVIYTDRLLYNYGDFSRKSEEVSISDDKMPIESILPDEETATPIAPITSTATMPVHIHVYENESVIQNPTCSTAGIRTYTCSCGQSKTELIPVIDHAWTAIKTMVHHEAEGEYQTIVVSPAWDETVIINSAWDETVVVSPAWDETVVISPARDEVIEVEKWHMQCDQCLVIMDDWTQTQITEHMREHALAGEGTRWGDRLIIESQTVHHDAITMIVQHDAVTEVVHHEAVTEVVHHDAVTEYKWIETRPAWDEEVVVSYQCTMCEIMQNK